MQGAGFWDSPLGEERTDLQCSQGWQVLYLGPRLQKLRETVGEKEPPTLKTGTLIPKEITHLQESQEKDQETASWCLQGRAEWFIAMSKCGLSGN